MSVDSVESDFNGTVWEGLEETLLPPFLDKEENLLQNAVEACYRCIAFAFFFYLRFVVIFYGCSL